MEVILKWQNFLRVIGLSVEIGSLALILPANLVHKVRKGVLREQRIMNYSDE
jgi:hypothetical protein